MRKRFLKLLAWTAAAILAPYAFYQCVVTVAPILDINDGYEHDIILNWLMGSILLLGATLVVYLLLCAAVYIIEGD